MVLVVQKTKNTEFSIDLTTVAPKLFNLLAKGGAITKESIDLACERGDIQVRRALWLRIYVTALWRLYTSPWSHR
jgi:hypothetical protein